MGTGCIIKAAQTYTRLDEDGLVTGYAEWRRTGYAFGPDDTEPLDFHR